MRTFGFAMLVFWVGCGGGGGGGAAGDTGSFDPGSPTVGGGLPADQPSSRYARSGWIEAGNPAGEQSFIAHASWFDAIHPAWWKLTADGSQIIAIPNGDVDQHRRGMDPGRAGRGRPRRADQSRARRHRRAGRYG